MEIYLDHNATSLIDPDVLSIMDSAYRDYYGNPSSVHAAGRKAKAKYLNAKDAIARYFRLSSKHVFFTHSATEALNWLIFHKPYKHIISSNLEHAAIYNSLKELEKRGTKVTFINAGAKGFVDASDLQKALTPNTDLIILGAANSETGIIQDTKALSLIAKQSAIPFYVDAVGIFGKAPFNIDPNVTAYVISSHKIHGPKGVAALVHKQPELLNPLYFGGYQENSKIAGTESLPQILGFAHAFQKVIDPSYDFEDIKAKRDFFESLLKKQCNIGIIGDDNPRVYNTSCIYFDDISGETLLQLLDHHKIYASHGSACSSGALEPSRVLINMDFGFKKAKQTLRFSLSKYTSKEQIIHTSDLIADLVLAAT